eukprot:1158604-Pelagomonas_calceolata.AAC.13
MRMAKLANSRRLWLISSEQQAQPASVETSSEKSLSNPRCWVQTMVRSCRPCFFSALGLWWTAGMMYFLGVLQGYLHGRTVWSADCMLHQGEDGIATCKCDTNTYRTVSPEVLKNKKEAQEWIARWRAKQEPKE